VFGSPDALRQRFRRTQGLRGRSGRRCGFQGKLVGKVGSGFTSTSQFHGGNESTILTMYNFMAHLG
jgi:multimeric flavodoxin WrbA